MAVVAVENPDHAQPQIGIASSVQPPTSALSSYQAVSILSNSPGNHAMVEFGLANSPHSSWPSAKALSWWDAAAAISSTYNLIMLPAGSGSTGHLSGSITDSTTLPVTLSGKALCESLAFAASPPEHIASPAVQHRGPWRLELLTMDLTQRRSLSSVQRWLSVRARVLGEPQLADFGWYHAVASFTQATNQQGEERSISLSTAPLVADAPVDNRGGKQNTLFFHGMQQQTNTINLNQDLIIGDLKASDHVIDLTGSLVITHQAKWEQQITIAANTWQSIPYGELQLLVAVLTDEKKAASLAHTYRIPNFQLRVPGILLAIPLNKEQQDLLPARDNITQIAVSISTPDGKSVPTAKNQRTLIQQNQNPNGGIIWSRFESIAINANPIAAVDTNAAENAANTTLQLTLISTAPLQSEQFPFEIALPIPPERVP